MNNTGTKHISIMKQTAFWREKNGEYRAYLKYSVPIFVEQIYKMQRLEVSGAVRPIYGSLGVKRLRVFLHNCVAACLMRRSVLLTSYLHTSYITQRVRHNSKPWRRMRKWNYWPTSLNLGLKQTELPASRTALFTAGERFPVPRE